MPMTRTQLLEAIEKGEAYLKRPDITAQEKEVAQRKIDRYYMELVLLSDEEAHIPDDPFETEPDTTPVPEQEGDDPAAMWMEIIRSKLQPIKEGVKRRA